MHTCINCSTCRNISMISDFSLGVIVDNDKKILKYVIMIIKHLH